jgi:hypothetical protein
VFAVQGDQMSVWKIAQIVAQPIFVKINAQLRPWKKGCPYVNVRYICTLQNCPKVINRPICKKSGHPGANFVRILNPIDIVCVFYSFFGDQR